MMYLNNPWFYVGLFRQRTSRARTPMFPCVIANFNTDPACALMCVKQTAQNGVFFKKSCENILSVHGKAIPLHSLFRKTHGQAL